jgi:hypothetical protein
MQNSKTHSNNLSRRGAMTVVGSALTAATISTPGASLAQTTQASSAPSDKDGLRITHKCALTT